ncbi:MAG: hypothetical protein DRJ50_14545, partial [Actinobacteria bacterium]
SDTFEDAAGFSIGQIPEGESYDKFRALAAGLAVAGANQVLGDAVSFTVAFIANKVLGKALTFSRADASTAIAAAVLVGWTIYQRTNFVAIGETLEERYSSIDSETVNEYELATTTPGRVELFDVVMAKMMAGTSLIRTSECRFHDTYNLPEACDVYAIQHFQGSRPDPEPDDAWVRYDTDSLGFGQAPPPAASNAQFFVVPTGTDFEAVVGGTAIDHRNEPNGNGVMPWVQSGVGPMGPSSQRFAFSTASDAYYLAENNALVSTYPPPPGSDPEVLVGDQWKYTHTILYTNWNNEWWMASRVGDTFLHRKKATMLEGAVGVGEYSGGNRCFAHPPAVAGTGASATLLGAWAPQGALCVMGNGTDLSQLESGDRIMLGGEIRKVRRIVNCSEFNFLSLFFGIFEECRLSDSYLDDESQKAIIVDVPFSDGTHEDSFDSLGQWRFPFSLVKLHDRKAGGNCPDLSSLADIERLHLEGPPTDVDCYYSPTLQYAREKAGVPFGVATGNLEIEDYWSAVVGARMRALDDEYMANEDSVVVVEADGGVLQNDFLPTPGNPEGRQPWSPGASVTLNVLTSPAEIIGSFDLADDGSFVYQPDPAFNDWDSRNWEQRIEYESCNSDAPEQCDRATLRFTVGNERAEALNIEVAVAGPDANENFTLSIDYDYSDFEGDPESLTNTQICVYENIGGQPQPKGIPCISGAGPRPLQYTLSANDYLSGSNLLQITPHAQRGKEQVPGEGFPGIAAFHGLTDETLLQIDAISLVCLPGSQQLAPELQEVVGVETWIECTATVDPYVPGEVFLESLLAESNYQYSFPNDYRWRRYHTNYEDTFDRQICTLEPDPDAPGLGICRFRWHSRSSDFAGDFPWGCAPWSLCVDEIETDFRAQLFDLDGHRTYRTVGQSTVL